MRIIFDKNFTNKKLSEMSYETRRLVVEIGGVEFVLAEDGSSALQVHIDGRLAVHPEASNMVTMWKMTR